MIQRAEMRDGLSLERALVVEAEVLQRLAVLGIRGLGGSSGDLLAARQDLVAEIEHAVAAGQAAVLDIGVDRREDEDRRRRRARGCRASGA